MSLDQPHPLRVVKVCAPRRLDDSDGLYEFWAVGESAEQWQESLRNARGHEEPVFAIATVFQ